MSSNKTNEGQDKTQQRENGFSRRTFMQGVGVGTGAVGAGVLTQEAKAAHHPGSALPRAGRVTRRALEHPQRGVAGRQSRSGVGRGAAGVGGAPLSEERLYQT